MDQENTKKIKIKEDADSGLDNATDSCPSGDEDPISGDKKKNLQNDSNSKSHTKDQATETEDITRKRLQISSNAKCLTKDQATETDELYENEQITDVSESFTSCRCSSSENILDTQKETELNKKPKKDVRIELLNCGIIFEEYREAVDFFKRLIVGQNETVDFSINSLTKKPEWLDEEKFKRGQKFARDYFFCINFAEMVSLFILFAQKSSLGPLIFTGKSDSPFTAFSRYLGTVTKLMSWYRDDLWGEGENLGKKNLNIVRGMHKNVYQKLTNTPEEDLETKITLGNPNTTALWCPLRDLLVTDFKESLCEATEEIQNFLEDRKVWVNQADMSITQFGFVGLAVTYPEYFGIYSATVEDLDAFLHMWRGLGYLLGIKDEYNYCDGDLETVRRRTKFFIETVAKPAFRDVTCDWEHMCRCLTSGIAFYFPQVNFESSLLYLCRVLDINTPRLSKSISYSKYFMYQMHRLVFYMMKFPGILDWLNCRLVEIIKKAQNASPEVLSKWRGKEFPYMNQEGKCPIRGQITSQNV